MDQTTTYYTLGIDIGSTTVKVALLDQDLHIIFSDYERHYANIQETLAGLLKKALNQTGPIDIIPVITGSGGLTSSFCPGSCGSCFCSPGLRTTDRRGH